MQDQLFIYLIVALNIGVQLMLIRSLRFPPGARNKFYWLALGIPLLIMLLMRVLVALGVIGSRTAEQSVPEAAITAAAGIIMMAAPWFVTLFAVINPARQAWIKKLRAETDEAV